MISIVLTPAPFAPRKRYHFDNDNEQNKYTNFKPGIEVLPAEYYGNETPGIKYYFRSIHNQYEKGHIGTGGIITQCSDGSTRTFYPDAVIVHPSEFGITNKPQFDNNIVKKRGRKSTPEGELKKLERERKIAEGIVLKRGRPSIDPSLRKTKPYVKNGRKRGRPSSNNNILKPNEVVVE